MKRQPSTEWGKPLQDTILLPDSIDKIGQGTNENQLFAHEPLKRIWKPLLSNTPVEQIFTVDEMGEIGSTTNCQVDFDIDLRGIVVKGEDENSLAQTLSKLQVVEASKVRPKPQVSYLILTVAGMSCCLSGNKQHSR